MASRPSLMDCAAAAAWSVDALSPPAAEFVLACSVLMMQKWLMSKFGFPTLTSF